MPDIITIIYKRWKFILGLTISATVIAFVAATISPKEYLSTATALPANSLMSDKARMFNSNIESLYSEFGTTDELDKIEGAVSLDTIFIATANELNLSNHYEIRSSNETLAKTVKELRQHTNITKSAYGELKIKVWDKDRNASAAIANTLLQKTQELYQNLQNENNSFVLQKMKEDYASKQQQFISVSDSLNKLPESEKQLATIKKEALAEQMKERVKLIDEYEMAIKSNPPVLLVVEKARPSTWADKPKTLQTATFTFFAALIFSLLLALFIESRKQRM